MLGLALCDPRTGGCRDGLLPDRTNENQGAESTLAYLGALVEMKFLEASLRPPRVSAGGQRGTLPGLQASHVREATEWYGS
jgi:hypothetical protein